MTDSKAQLKKRHNIHDTESCGCSAAQLINGTVLLCTAHDS